MSTFPPETPTISIDEAAAILGISRSSAYRLAEIGDLPTIKLGVRARRVLTTAFLEKYFSA